MDEIDRCRQGLDTARKRREEAEQSWRDASEGLAKWARRAREAGMTMTEVARLAGVSRVTAYKLVERNGPKRIRGPRSR